jgi:hypothetical protein
MTRLDDFSPIGLLFVGSLMKYPKMAVPWATNLLHFHLTFKNVFCILALFGLAAVLATLKKLGNFFQIIWSPWLQAKKDQS